MANAKCVMQWWRGFALITLTLLLNACSAEDPVKNQHQATKPAEPVAIFDLAQVKQDYQNLPLKVLDISERNRDGRNALAVTLSVPLDPAKDHQSYFNVSQKGGGVVDGGWVLDPSGKVAWFSHTNPNSEYDITVYQGLTAATGVSLSQNANSQITTRDLTPSVNFDTNGAFLAKGLSNGLPVVTVNIPQVNIDFFKIKSDQIQTFLNQVGDGDFYYWNINHMLAYGELVYSGRYDLQATENTRVKRNIDVGAVKELQPSGVYFAVMQPAGKYNNMQAVWFSVTDLGLHARQYKNRIDVHVSSLKSGKPLTGIKVSLIDNKNKLVKESKTSPDGLASFTSIPPKIKLIVAQTTDQYSVIETRKPALDLSEFDLGKRPQLPVELFIYAPRDLYRPGEMIDFSGLIRDGDGRKTKATVLNGQIKRPDGSVVKHFKWQPQQLGYYHYNWSIPSDAAVGDWSLEVSGALQYPVKYRFKVEEFLPERMKLNFNNGKTEPVVTTAKGKLKVPVTGEYLYGAPAAGNRLSTLVNISQWRSPIESLKNYQFGDINDGVDFNNYDLKDFTLNDQGQGEIVVPSRWQGVKSPMKIKLISSLYESGGRPVTRVYSALMWPADALIGIRSSFGDSDKNDGPSANSRVSFDIVKANVAGQLQAASNLEVKLVREDRQYFWVYSNSRGWHYDWSDKEFTEVSQTLDIEAGKAANVAFPVSYGHYRLQVRDPANKLLSSVRFYAGNNWYARWRNANSDSQAARPDKVTIALDKAHYKAGDIAKVTIVPPDGGEAIVMVEGDGPLWMKRVNIAKAGATVDIPVSADWQQHNLYVTAMVLRKGDNKQSITPKRSFGLAFLKLDREPRQLQVAINTPEKVLPERTVSAQINVTDAQGAKINDPVYVTLAAVDVGVLSISNFTTPSPFEHFFGQRRYGVESRDIYDQVIELNDAPKARLRFGGDADLSRGGKEPESDVQIVSLFSGLVALDNGVADIDLKLPDFNGRLRLMAVAFSAQDVGNGEKEMTVAAPVVTQMAMPRFLATGDKATIALDVNNLSGQAQTLTVNLSSSGPVKLNGHLQNKPQVITLADKQKTTLKFAVEATGFSGQAQFDLQVSGLKLDDETSTINRSWTLGVRPPYPALTEFKSQVLSKGEEFALDGKDISLVLPQTVEALLSVSPKANLNLPEQLQNLLAYPYGCLEQTSSRAFPLTYATRERQVQFGLKVIDEQERLKMITTGIDRIASMQRKNGGFGLWSNQSAEEHWLTAFVGDFLLKAREMGVDVPAPLVDKTMKRLTQYVNRGGRFFNERWSENKKHYTFAYKAYAAYVLSRVNQAPLGSMRTLYDRKSKQSQTGLPLVQLGLALHKMGDKKRGLAAIELGLNRVPTKRQYYGDYGSSIRDNAMIIHLLLSNNVSSNISNTDDSYNAKAIEMSFALAKTLKSHRWLSTQERNALFLAGIALQSNTADSWLATVFLGASEQAVNQTSNYHQRLDGGMISRGVAVQSQHDKPLFVSASMSGYGLDKPAARSEGMEVQREWYNKDGELLPSGHGSYQVKVGELVIVRLLVSAEERTPDGLVVDMIPAGFELENQNLEHAIKLDDFKFNGSSYAKLTRYTRIKHQEYRDDRFVAALDVGRRQGGSVFYLMRAVTPGTYKVPASLVEDMYHPQKRGVGQTLDSVTIVAP